jgi:hypothetical protein
MPIRFYLKCEYVLKTKFFTGEYKELESELWEDAFNTLIKVNVGLGSKGGWFIFLYKNVKEVYCIAEKVEDKDYAKKVEDENNLLKINKKYKYNLVLY